MDYRDGRAPVALPRDEPVVQTVLADGRRRGQKFAKAPPSCVLSGGWLDRIADKARLIGGGQCIVDAKRHAQQRNWIDDAHAACVGSQPVAGGKAHPAAALLDALLCHTRDDYRHVRLVKTRCTRAIHGRYTERGKKGPFLDNPVRLHLLDRLWPRQRPQAVHKPLLGGAS